MGTTTTTPPRTLQVTVTLDLEDLGRYTTAEGTERKLVAFQLPEYPDRGPRFIVCDRPVDWRAGRQHLVEEWVTVERLAAIPAEYLPWAQATGHCPVEGLDDER